jgi:RIO kinase 1
MTIRDSALSPHMRLPESLQDLLDLGVIDEVIRPLMSGKEAQVYLVVQGGEHRVAKIYKEAQNRSFRQLSTYSEGRRYKNSRRQRAMGKRTRYGKEQEEIAWKSAEVEAIHRLSAAGVRVPRPYDFVDGVFVMELVADHRGEPAPRLVDLHFTPDEARDVFQQLVREVVRMLCAGLVHADLSDFNVLIAEDGPVIIDFPQAVEAAANNNARKLLIRDVKNLQLFLSRFAPELKNTQYGLEIWNLYEKGVLFPDTKLTGKVKRRSRAADTASILREIGDAADDEAARRKREGLAPLAERKPSKYAQKKAVQRAEAAKKAPPPKPAAQRSQEAPKKKRRRRKSKGGREERPKREAAPAKKTAFSDFPDDLDSLLEVG